MQCRVREGGPSRVEGGSETARNKSTEWEAGAASSNPPRRGLELDGHM